MLNKKILITYLTLLLIMILYIINQVLFLNMLLNPANTQYSWVNDEFTGYLIADNNEYVEAAKKIDANGSSCTIFIDENTHNAIYTNECNLNKKTYVSESQPFLDKSFISYDSIYEYLYGIKILKPFESVSDLDFPRYNLIFSNDDEKVMYEQLKDFNFKKLSSLYSVYEEDYKSLVLWVQVKILTTSSATMLLLYIVGYVSLKRKELFVYKILGLDNIMIVRKIFIDLFVMLTTSYAIAISVFSLVIWLNGRLFFMSMYFEYMDKFKSGLLYIILILVILIILSFYYMQLRRKDD